MRLPQPVKDPAEHQRAVREGRLDDLILWHARLAASLAREFHGDRSELLSVALEALCKAAKTWDHESPKASAGFKPWATRVVWNALCAWGNHERYRYKAHVALETAVVPRSRNRRFSYVRDLAVAASLPPSPTRRGKPRRKGPGRWKNGVPLIRRIVDHLDENGPKTVAQLASELNATLQGCKKQVWQLVTDGRIEREALVPTAGRFAGRYRLKKPFLAADTT